MSPVLIYAASVVVAVGGGVVAFVRKAKTVNDEEAEEAEARVAVLALHVNQIVQLYKRDKPIGEGRLEMVDEDERVALLNTNKVRDKDGHVSYADPVERSDIREIHISADIEAFDDEGNDIFSEEDSD